MNIAVIIAGGSGQRMGQDIPKQFVNILDKPVLVYTLLGFQAHPLIDGIVVVCIDGWHQVVKAYCKQFNITKLKKVVQAGATCQESIRNGLSEVADLCSEDDIVIIHDGIRPLVDKNVLTDVIEKCKTHGNGITSMPYNEQIFLKDDENSTVKYISRDTLRRVSTPQAYKYGIVSQVYKEAFQKNIGIGPGTYANTLMVDFGHRLYFALGSDRNIKLTTKDDLELFKAYLQSPKDSWLK